MMLRRTLQRGFLLLLLLLLFLFMSLLLLLLLLLSLLLSQAGLCKAVFNVREMGVCSAYAHQNSFINEQEYVLLFFSLAVYIILLTIVLNFWPQKVGYN